MQMEGVFSHSMELDQAVLGVAPKALDSVDVVGAESEFVVAS
jgi:hypothetical protein